jgi:hypothetical protein
MDPMGVLFVFRLFVAKASFWACLISIFLAAGTGDGRRLQSA